MSDIELVHFELNNWFSGRDYPLDEPFISWVNHRAFSNDKWCKKNKLVVLSGNIDMSANWCIIAPKSWVKENCPALLYNKKYKYTVIQYSADGPKEIEYEKSMSDFIRHPDEDGDVYGKFGWRFPEYSEENFGVHYYDEDEPSDASKRVTSIPEGFKAFECENGKTYCAKENACWFCKHLDDVVWDYTHGPYLLHCDIDKDPEIGTSGECDSFEYIKRDWEVEV